MKRPIPQTLRIVPAIALLAVLVSACGGGKNSVTGPTTSTPPPTTAPAPAPAPAPPPIPRVTLVGVLTDANTNAAVGGATVSVTTTTNTSVTDGNGFFSIPGVQSGSVTVTATKASYNRAVETFTLPGSDTRRDMRIVPFWKVSGKGNTVFDMPSYVSRVRIDGVWDRTQNSNLIVRVAGRLVVNEILRETITYTGVHLVTGGGVVEITNSVAVAWTFTQEQ